MSCKAVVAEIEIMEWSPMVGEHFNGKIIWRDEHDKFQIHRLAYKMNIKQAKLLNKKDGTGSGYSPGMLTERYFTKEALISDAIRFMETAPLIDVLAEGNAYQPGIVHFCRDSKISERLREVGAEFEAMYDESDDPWELDKEKADRLQEEWKKLLASFKRPNE